MRKFEASVGSNAVELDYERIVLSDQDDYDDRPRDHLPTDFGEPVEPTAKLEVEDLPPQEDKQDDGWTKVVHKRNRR